MDTNINEKTTNNGMELSEVKVKKHSSSNLKRRIQTLPRHNVKTESHEQYNDDDQSDNNVVCDEISIEEWVDDGSIHYDAAKMAKLLKDFKVVVTPLTAKMLNKCTRPLFVCNLCKFTSNYPSGLKEHILTQHTDLQPYECDHCSYRSNRRSYLNNHRLTAHNISTKIVHTKLSYDTVISHKQAKLKLIEQKPTNHTEEKPFACELCSFKCHLVDDLKEHKLIHTEKKPFACTQCNYTCSFSFELRIHKLKHPGKKVYACDQCNFKCNGKSNMKAHKLTHGDNIKPNSEESKQTH